MPPSACRRGSCVQGLFEQRGHTVQASRVAGIGNVESVVCFDEVVSPDFEEVSALMRANWTPPCWVYERDLLTMHILRPTADPSMAVGLRATNGDLASYLAFVPLRLRVGGRVYRAVFGSFFTVSGRYRRHRLSDRQQGLMLDRARDQGYELYVAVTVAGTPANQTVARAFAARGLTVQSVRNFRYLAGVPAIISTRLGPGDPGRVRCYEPADAPAAFTLLSACTAQALLAKVVEREDIDFLLRLRPRVTTYVYEAHGEVLGLVSLSFLPVLSERVGMNAYVEAFAVIRLEPTARVAFVDTVLRAALAQGAEAVMVPDTGCADLDVFRRLGFRAAPRKLRLLLGALRPDITGLPEAVDRFCLDVF